MFTFPAGEMGVVDPRSLGTCEIWLRSDLGITTSGTAVKTWANQGTVGTSGNATSSGAGTPVYSAAGGVNGLPKITFDGTKAMAWAFSNQGASGARTWVLVWKMLSTPGSGFSIYSCKINNVFSEIIVDFNTYKNVSWVDGFGTGNMVGYDFSLGTSLVRYHIHTYSGGTSSATGSYTATQDNATQTVLTSGAYGITTTPEIGARSDGSFASNVDLYEIMSYAGQFNASQLNTLNTYLKSRYAL